MPRIIVITDPPSAPSVTDASVLLDEHVHSVHLSSEHAAAQLVERIAWAIGDAERLEHAPKSARPRRERETRPRIAVSSAHTTTALAA
jgi:hypothetical protein